MKTRGSRRMGNAVSIGGERECFFDGELLDPERSSAELRLHHPVRREAVLVHDAPWEGSGCNYHNFFFDETWHGVDGGSPEGCYRMYYLGWQCPSKEPGARPYHPIVACYAESRDGIHWTKPDLGLTAYEGDKKNNIVLMTDVNHTGPIDNFMVFRDDNPACPPDARYKGVGFATGGLRSYLSSDGLRFREGDYITKKGTFDSLNVVFWDARAGLYRGYVRGFHRSADPRVKNKVRHIAYIESADFRKWSAPKLLEFDDGEDIPLYTNVIQPYFRAPRLLIGFPTRYVERAGWNGSFEELGGREFRRSRMEMEPRYGLAMTDCAFIVSRDGRSFHRFREAFMRPELENGVNWVYGDCYPARGFAVTPNTVPGAPDELSLYACDNHWSARAPSVFCRYTIRMDGFASLHADGAERIAATKCFFYEGEEMRINFATSARGSLFVTLIDADGRRFASCETFGNALDRKVVFDDPLAVKRSAGKPVVLEFRLRDADLYSMQFR